MSLESFNAMKKSRSSYNMAVTRMRNRYLRIAEENPSSFDLGAMASSLASLEKSATSFRKVQDDICDFDTATSDIPFNLDDEFEIGDTFEECRSHQLLDYPPNGNSMCSTSSNHSQIRP